MAMLDEDLERLAERVVEKLDARRAPITPRLMTLETTARYLERSLSAVQHLVKTRYVADHQTRRQIAGRQAGARQGNREKHGVGEVKPGESGGDRTSDPCIKSVTV
jgi:hypothetical protein